jgi:hypothetical protein
MSTKATAGETNEQELEEKFVELLDHYRGEPGALVPLLQELRPYSDTCPRV